MSVIKEQIRQSPEFQQQQGQGEPTDTQPQQRRGVTVGDSLAAMLDVEQGEAVLWLQVAQLIVLYLILRELRGGGA